MLIPLVSSNVRFFLSGKLFSMYEFVRVSSISRGHQERTTSYMLKDSPEETSASRVSKTTIKTGSHNCSNLTCSSCVALTFTVLVADIWITCSCGQRLQTTVHSLSSPLLTRAAGLFWVGICLHVSSDSEPVFCSQLSTNCLY